MDDHLAVFVVFYRLKKETKIVPGLEAYKDDRDLDKAKEKMVK